MLRNRESGTSVMVQGSRLCTPPARGRAQPLLGKLIFCRPADPRQILHTTSNYPSKHKPQHHRAMQKGSHWETETLSPRSWIKEKSKMELEHVWEEEIIRTCHTQAMQTNSIESCHLKKKIKKSRESLSPVGTDVVVVQLLSRDPLFATWHIVNGEGDEETAVLLTCSRERKRTHFRSLGRSRSGVRGSCGHSGFNFGGVALLFSTAAAPSSHAHQECQRRMPVPM